MNPSFQRPETSSQSRPNPEKQGSIAFGDVASDPTFEADTLRPKPERSDPDEALRTAIAAAVDARDFDRVRALVVVLESSPKPALVLTLASRKTSR